MTDTPVEPLPSPLLAVAVFALFIVSGSLWIRVLRRRLLGGGRPLAADAWGEVAREETVLAAEGSADAGAGQVGAGELRRVVAPWGLIDLVATFLLLSLMVALLLMWVRQRMPMGTDTPLHELPPSVGAQLLWINSLGMVLGTALGLVTIHMRTLATPRDLGWSRRECWSDLWLGARLFLLWSGPVLLLQILLTIWFPYHHPLIDMLTKHRGWQMLLANVVAAVVVAPVCEELLFRVLLQGWLDNIGQRGLLPVDWLVGPAAERRQVLGVGGRWWPVLVSAGLFAAAHATQGPAPIPLFVLSLVLGRLYQETGRVLPGIVVHFLLNSWSFGLLLLQLFQQGWS